MKRFYITTPIYYVNDRPHIGHAYTTVAADVLARWKRMSGVPVFFLTGTDEHGSKIVQAAQAKGLSPQEFVDGLAGEFRKLWETLGISCDDFIRTTEDRHVRVVQSAFSALLRKGEITKGFYEDWYCVACESFWLENELAGNACPDCGRKVERLKEESYFFRLSKYGQRLLDLYAGERGGKNFLSGRHSLEMENFVRAGLKDISVSRLNEKWGVPVPEDPRHTVYVWVDALLNYITAAGFAPDPRTGAAGIDGTIWPCDVHFVGKEIFRFHAITWPALLDALGLEPPRKVFSHGWWTVEGEKMSKSKGNIVDPFDMVREFGVDGFRYFLLREIPFGADGDFSRNALVSRYNSDLANNLGNLFSRVLTLIDKFYGGILRAGPEGAFASPLAAKFPAIEDAFERIAFQEVLEILQGAVAEANRYLDERAPWNAAKTDPAGAEKVLAECLLVLRWLAAAFWPFMPGSSQTMWKRMGETGDLARAGARVLRDPFFEFSPGKKTERGAILFPRIQK
ncbi:MAG: methionine--tRNA ligase [Elusimicrobia bacterium RIFCSPLOWO2_01_FULL_64_13]|nr:MAG: methionine--tRNA ligase [Elusimicrobia bacterium RIFCSPHIGHO2_01_FULL_64_10]OGR97919.1 MAG: methionine--tRNA ligase [Elusimicrobia bacterium RIFCSPLOWO2_01_FULL_64_13]